MPKLIRLYILNVAIGFLLAVIFSATLIALDVAHLRHLVFSDRAGWIAVLMMLVFFTVLFGGVQFAIAVMRMAEDPQGPSSGRRIRVFTEPSRIPAPANGRDRRK